MRRAVLVLGFVLLAAAWTAREAVPSLHAQESQPRLASLSIDIWPEFDRQATVLVMLIGELAPDVPLPATLTLRIPASSGGPAAVASRASGEAELFDLDYELSRAEDSLLVKFTTSNPIFQMEFYEPLTTDTSERTYTYVWPGDLPVDQLTVGLQEPAGSSQLTVEPDLGASSPGGHQLPYRSAQMGALEAGKTLTVTVRYHKEDPRTSAEILGLGGPSQAEPAGGAGGGGDGIPVWLIHLLFIPVVVLVAAAGGYWLAQRQLVPDLKGPGPQPRGQQDRQSAAASESPAFCIHCGNRLRPTNRFCPQCGTLVRGK